ncbi:MAG: hypothetical protein AAF614_35300 [Chloroflexota bacterium]
MPASNSIVLQFLIVQKRAVLFVFGLGVGLALLFILGGSGDSELSLTTQLYLWLLAFPLGILTPLWLTQIVSYLFAKSATPQLQFVTPKAIESLPPAQVQRFYIRSHLENVTFNYAGLYAPTSTDIHAITPRPSRLHLLWLLIFIIAAVIAVLGTFNLLLLAYSVFGWISAMFSFVSYTLWK